MSSSEGEADRKRSSQDTPAKAWRRHVTFPGVLAESVRKRWEEFGYRAFSPYAVELVCFDLRTRSEHYVTLRFSRDTPSAQDAVDREIVRHYRPHGPRQGALVRALVDQAAEDGRNRALEPGALASQRQWIFFPAKLQEPIELRWRELGYEGLSAYVTALMRYDLMLSGPHRHFTAADMHPEVLAALDAETTRQFHAGRRRKILLEYLVEEAAGRALEQAEREERMRELAERMRGRALKP